MTGHAQQPSQACDPVWHTGLLHEPHAGLLLQLLKLYLTDPKLTVKLDSHFSDW
jgi:hypothetical protein